MNNITKLQIKTLWLTISICAIIFSLFATHKSNKNIEKQNRNANIIEQNIKKIAILKQNQSQDKLDIQNAISDLKKLQANDVEHTKIASTISIQWNTEKQLVSQQILSLSKNGCTVDVLNIKTTNPKQVKIQTHCAS